MRLLLSLLLAVCLPPGGGVITIDHGDAGTPTLTAGKQKLADAALVKPPLVKVGAGLLPDQSAASPPRSRALAPLHVASAPAPSVTLARNGAITPAALLSFAGHPTRAGP